VGAAEGSSVGKRQRDEIPDTLVLVEHPTSITLGRGTHRENVLAPGDMPLFEMSAAATSPIHVPGRGLVGYPIFLLREPERDLHLYLRKTSREALIRGGRSLGIRGRAQGGAGPGVGRRAAHASSPRSAWPSSAGVTLHGSHQRVDRARALRGHQPCGLEATTMGSMEEHLGRAISFDEVRPRRATARRVFARQLT